MASMPSARSIGIGAFVLGGILLFSLALFLIGNRRMLFAESFVTYAEFKGISGIQVGAGVRVAGMDAGEVKEIQVPLSPAGRFRLRMQVRADLHPLVRTDSVASIQTEGLVGAQFVQIGAGTAAAPRVADGGTVLSREPLEFGDLLVQMSETVGQVNQTIATLRDDIEQTIGTIQKTASDADALIGNVAVDVKAISESSAKVFADTRELVAGVRAGRGTVGRLFTDEELYRKLAATVDDAQRTVASMRGVAEQAQSALQGAGGRGGQLGGLTTDLSVTLGKTRESMSNLADATEALKHNFLLRGFFTRRGYFNLADLPPAEYRTGALEAEGRRVLRVWLAAPVLFARDAGGVEALTDEGKARLDSAMAGFLAYRKSGPLMVEGYGEGADTSQRYLRSRDRAALVRSYLVERFQLDPASTGAIALGHEAKASPTGNRWDGVALALFVRPEVLGNKE